MDELELTARRLATSSKTCKEIETHYKELMDSGLERDAAKGIVKRAKQTKKAGDEGVSNCPYCAIGHDANRTRIWKLADMDADHVTAWSKGGSTSIENCQMLCKAHNRAKGNK